MSVNTRIYGEHYCRYDSVIHSVDGGGIYQCDDLIPWNSTGTSGGLILKSYNATPPSYFGIGPL